MPKKKSNPNGIEPSKLLMLFSIVLLSSVMFFRIMDGFHESVVLGINKSSDTSSSDSKDKSSDSSDDKSNDESSDKSTDSNNSSDDASLDSSTDQSVDTSVDSLDSSIDSGSGASGVNTYIYRTAPLIISNQQSDEEVEKTVKTLSPAEYVVTSKVDQRRVNLTSGNVKTKLKYNNGDLRVEAQYEDGRAVELEGEALDVLNSHLSEEGVSLQKSGEDGFLLERNGSAAIVSAPLEVNLNNNEFMVGVGGRQVPIQVLPDDAVLNMISAGVISQVNQDLLGQLQEDGVTDVQNLISLDQEGTEPVYELDGFSDQRFLAIIPVRIQKQVKVSAVDGELVEVEQTNLSKILDFLSF